MAVHRTFFINLSAVASGCASNIAGRWIMKASFVSLIVFVVAAAAVSPPLFVSPVNYARGLTPTDAAKGQFSFCCICAVLGSRGMPASVPAKRIQGWRCWGNKVLCVTSMPAVLSFSTQKLLPALNRIVSFYCCCSQRERNCVGLWFCQVFKSKGRSSREATARFQRINATLIGF